METNCILYSTTFNNAKKNQTTQWLRLVPDIGIENEVVNLYPKVKYQQFEGFGGAFTDSAGYVFSLMDTQRRLQLLNAYYGPDGLGYTLGRTHLDSCDFSVGHYQAVDDPTDTTLQRFTLERSEKYILPLLRAAQNIYGKKIPLMAAPWSPPDFMKTTGLRNYGGALKSEFKSIYAAYLCRYIKELKKAGADIVRLTIQNEPNAWQTWDSCLYTPLEEKEFIRDFLYPALLKNSLEDVELFIWDHNKERVYERACDIIDDETDSMVSGVAFHWYSGDHFEALNLVRERFPEKKMVQSEACIEFRHYSQDGMLFNAQKYAHDLIGDFNGGMTAFYDWNLVLDEKGGPNHVQNYCDSPFLYHTDTGVLEERATYAYLGHFTKHIRPNARRIAFSRYCEAADVTAFENTDGSISAVFLNRTKEYLPIVLRVNGLMTYFTLPSESISTFVIPG